MVVLFYPTCRMYSFLLRSLNHFLQLLYDLTLTPTIELPATMIPRRIFRYLRSSFYLEERS